MSTHKKPIYLIVTILVFTGLVWYITGISFFTIKKIDCSTQYGPCPQPILDSISSLKNHKILRPISKPSSLYVNTITFHRRLPSTLVVDIILKKPIGVIGNSLVDENGVILGQATSSALPRLESDDISQVQISSLRILNIVAPLVSGQLIGQVSSKTLSVKSPSGLEILFDVDKPTQTWYPALQLLLEKSKIDGKIPRIIDLRYHEPVLTY